jgi:hypothetical protein
MWRMFAVKHAPATSSFGCAYAPQWFSAPLGALQSGAR